MCNIKLLFITKDFSSYTERNTYYLIKELEKLVDLEVCHEGGELKDILSKAKQTPDFILLNDLKESRSPEVKGLLYTNIPIGIIVHDLHYKTEKRLKFMEENNIRHMFVIYRDAFLETFPQFQDRMLWLPHFVNTEIFKDYGQQKDIDWLMMGLLAFYYPLREKIYERMKDIPGFVYHGHPGYRNIGSNEEDIYVGEKYAREINRAKIFLTDDSHFHYPLIKYYEVLACKTLLLAPSSKELEDLGFLPGVHFVPINKHDFMYKAEYYLFHEEERNKIAQAGYDMVHAKHSVAVRAHQLVDYINKRRCFL